MDSQEHQVSQVHEDLMDKMERLDHQESVDSQAHQVNKELQDHKELQGHLVEMALMEVTAYQVQQDNRDNLDKEVNQDK